VEKSFSSNSPDFLVHDAQDSVGVAVVDLAPQSNARGRLLSGETLPAVTLRDAIPLGHKLALKDLAKGDRVIKYGQVIGEAKSSISAGGHVHTHNLRGLRWAKKENQ
jgi:(2R)-sulfolactate sulfo-lyase subunit alpha